MASTDIRNAPPPAPIDRPERSGNAWLVLAMALMVVASALALSFFQREWSEPFVLALLAFLSVIGVFSLFAWAVGLVDIAGQSRRFDLTKALADGMPEGLLVTDGDGRIVYANTGYLQITGADGRRDVRSIDRVFAGDPDVAEAIYRLTNAARAGKKGTEEVRVRPRGPTEEARWLKLRVQPLDRGKGRPYAVWTVADVTRDRERQENIVQELQHAIDYLDHAPIGFFSVEADGRIAYMNATLSSLLDRDLGDTATGGLRLTDLVPSAQASLFTGLAARPGDVRTEVFDIDLLTRSGQSRPVRIYHRLSFAADGTPGASRTLVLDRAPGSDSAETLRAAEVRFARFFNSAPMAIATVDKDFGVVRSNAPFARLFPSAAAKSRPILDVVAEKDRQHLTEALAAARAGKGGVAPVDVALAGEATRSGRFYVSAAEETGDEEAAIVFAVDTTEQRALETQFAQSQKMNAVGQLAGGIAHDFNNVLTAIIGFSDLLLANHRPTDPSFQDIMNIKQNANRAAGLVRQLLAFSRRQTLRPQVLNLGDMLSELSILLGRLLGERIKLEVKHGRDLWFVKADLNQLEQVVVNLAVNARDAMPGGGKLTILTANVSAEEARERYSVHASLPPADYVLIEVADTGVGIPPEIIDKIFEPFFSTKEVGKGTGLGLSTVYGIVRQTGGFVFVDSAPGAGASFRIFLPRHIPTEAELPAKPDTKPQASNDLTGQGTILLVEDEEAVRAFAARALTSRGYRVIEAGTGTQALELLMKHGQDIALVVSDVVMPEMDGPTLLKELRKFAPDLKIVFMSGYAEEAFRRTLEENESFVFLPKPFSLKQLAQTVKDSLGR